MANSSRGLLSHLIQVDRAAQTRGKSGLAEQPQGQDHGKKDGTEPTHTGPTLSSEAGTVPAHIIAVTEVRKLNAQTPYFRCPVWADLPPRPYHLHCTREGVILAALALHRFPFYLFGKSAVCDYVLEHPSVSAVHAALVYHRQQECFVLVDLGSTNGVRLNTERVAARKPVPAPVGSVIQFGYSTRLYEIRTGVPPSSKRVREEQMLAVTAQQHGSRETANSLHGSAGAAERSGLAPVIVVVTARASPMPAGADSAQPTSEDGAAVHRTSIADPVAISHTATPLDTEKGVHASVQSSSTRVSTSTDRVPHASTDNPDTKSRPHRHTDTNGSTSEETRENVQTAVTHRSDCTRRAHLYQLVVKHKDVGNPVSRGQRKGELITRSREDALDIVQSIVRAHELRCGARTSATADAEGETRGVRQAAASAQPVRWRVEEFIAMVLQYCEVSSQKKRGDLGVVEEGTFTEDFDRAAFALRRGEVSEPVETPLGIHLIYRCD